MLNKRKKPKTKKGKEEFVDDGRSFTNMNVEGMPYYDRLKRKRERKDKKKNLSPFTSKERRQIIKAAYKAYLPIFLICIIGFVLAFLFIKYVWLR